MTFQAQFPQMNGHSAVWDTDRGYFLVKTLIFSASCYRRELTTITRKSKKKKKKVYKMYKFKHFYWAKSIFLPLLKLCNLLRISRTNVLFQGLAMTTVAHPLYMKPSDNFLSMAHKTIQIKVMSLLKLHLVYTHLCLMSFSILAVSAPPYYKNLLCECFM